VNGTPSVSVIIPTLNEANRIAPLIERTRAVGDCQIIVVDGGSDDGTFDRAEHADVRLQSPRGRALQQNAGAAAAHGETLVFLHADCWLEPGAFESANRMLSRDGVIAGCFHQVIEAAGLRYRLLERGNDLRARLFGWAYGDQGFFMRRERFERLGGFPAIPFLEDLFFSKSLKRCGRIAMADAVIHVSARRWQRRGVARQTLLNWTIVALAQLGVAPARLLRLYR
jgi:rSAM/selenodomain-associated transferase 2